MQSLGCQVDFVSNGEEAVNAWSRGKYDLILMDCNMPTMDGYEAAAKLKRRFHEAHIFAITGRCGPLERQRSLAAGFEEHLEKPVDVATIERLIAAYGDAS